MTTARARPTRKSKGSYHHGDLRRALLDVTRKRLQQVGPDELSLRDIARRAGVSHAAAYHHFKDKTALLESFCLDGFERLDANMASRMEAAGSDPFERLVASGIAYVSTAFDDPAAFHLMFSAPRLWTPSDKPDPLAPDEDNAGRGAAFFRLLDAVRAARDACGMPPDGVLGDACVMWPLVQGLAQLGMSGRFSPVPMAPLDIARASLVRAVDGMYPTSMRRSSP